MKGTVLTILFILILNSAAIASPRDDRPGKVNHHSDIQKERKGNSGHRSPVYNSVSKPPKDKHIHRTQKMKSGGSNLYIVDDVYNHRYKNEYYQIISPYEDIEILNYSGR